MCPNYCEIFHREVVPLQQSLFLVCFAEAWRSCVEELQGKLDKKSGELQKSTNIVNFPL